MATKNIFSLSSSDTPLLSPSGVFSLSPSGVFSLSPSDTPILSPSDLIGGSIGNEIRINNDTMLSGFSGRADACRRMTGKENAYRRMIEEELSPSDTPSLSSLGKSRRDATRGSIKTMNSSLLDSPIKSGNDREKGLSPSGVFSLSPSGIPSLSFPRRRESIKHYCRLFTLVCGILIISTIALAEDTTTETCANGAGTVITGAVTGHKYCMNNFAVNWWNANAWCDALGRRLFDRSDCACGNTVADCRGKCPELVGVGKERWFWTASPSNSSHNYAVRLLLGDFSSGSYRANTDNIGALCY